MAGIVGDVRVSVTLAIIYESSVTHAGPGNDKLKISCLGERIKRRLSG